MAGVICMLVDGTLSVDPGKLSNFIGDDSESPVTPIRSTDNALVLRTQANVKEDVIQLARLMRSFYQHEESAVMDAGAYFGVVLFNEPQHGIEGPQKLAALIATENLKNDNRRISCVTYSPTQ